MESLKSINGYEKSGSIQISSSREGPWTTMRLNYGSPVACWQLGNDLVASEVRVNDGNRYVDIRSLVSVRNNTDFTLDLCLKLRTTKTDAKSVIGERKEVQYDGSELATNELFESQIMVGALKPGETIPIPLSCLDQSASYLLHLKPLTIEAANQYSWSSVMDISAQSQDLKRPDELPEVCVSTLVESEKLLYCTEIGESSSNSSRGVWFCLNIQATEIAKDVQFNPIQDWTIVVRPPVTIANYLPLMAEISLLEMQATGHFLSCYRGVSSPGESVKVYGADIRSPLYFSLLPQKGWLPLQVSLSFEQNFFFIILSFFSFW